MSDLNNLSPVRICCQSPSEYSTKSCNLDKMQFFEKEKPAWPINRLEISPGIETGSEGWEWGWINVFPNRTMGVIKVSPDSPFLPTESSDLSAQLLSSAAPVIIHPNVVQCVKRYWNINTTAAWNLCEHLQYGLLHHHNLREHFTLSRCACVLLFV